MTVDGDAERYPVIALNGNERYPQMINLAKDSGDDNDVTLQK